jgi:hypothetical protein
MDTPTPSVQSSAISDFVNGHRYYAIAKGRRPGIYDDFVEAYEQIDQYPNYLCRAFPDCALAAEYLQGNGIPDEEIRLFRKTFKQQPDFTPNPTAPFKQEFQRFESSQQWTKQEARKARVDFIRDEIIKYCLPDGIRIDLDQNEEDRWNLDDDQCLEVYQAMCQKARKPVHSTINECLLELKRRPFVNLLDFIDAWRTGSGLRTFDNWSDFVRYTRKRRIDVETAREDEFLAPLLQHLTKGPLAIDPIAVRNAHVQKRLRRRRQQNTSCTIDPIAVRRAHVQSRAAILCERKRKRQTTPFVARADSPHVSSPSAFYQSLPSPPKSPTPVPQSPPSILHDPGVVISSPHIKPEPPITPPSSLTIPDTISVPPPTDSFDIDIDSDPEWFEEVMKIESSCPALIATGSQNLNYDSDSDFDAEPDFFEEMIKVESSMPTLSKNEPLALPRVLAQTQS